MATDGVFDDPVYTPVPDISDGSYDSPSQFLDRVPQQHADEAAPNEQTVPTPEQGAGSEERQDPTSQPAIEDSGGYSTIDDFLQEEDDHDSEGGEGSPWDTDFEEEDEEEEEEDGEGEGGEEEGGGKRMSQRRKMQVRQSHTKENGEKLEGSDKIYVEGSIFQLKPMISFKSRLRSRSKAQLEEDGIYQGLVMVDEQKRQIGIMPESIYMTTMLERCRDELENMSMEINEEPVHQPTSATQSSVTPYYRGLVLHPPPLPPLNQGAPTTQRKCHAIIENVLKSEAAFLTSLKVAEQVYMKPLLGMSNPPIDREQVKILFGPIRELMTHHELFYTALTQRSMDWGPKQTVGNVFMIFYRREVIGHYVKYVNNFTDAMGTLQKNISKRPKFVSFLKEKYKESKTSLSLQGLLLKPVQRFPQYILFLQDLIKYTPPHHPDRVALQLALARCETIAEHLNEAKRTTEQQTIVGHLSARVTQLPFKLTDSPNRCLLMQEPVTRLMLSPQGSENLKQRKFSLLLFNNMAMCATIKKSTGTAPRDVSPYDDVHYKCEWSSPLDKLSVMEPDYSNDIWDYVIKQDGSEEAVSYKRLKSQLLQHTQDFETMGRITSLVATLASNYAGLRVESVQCHMRVLQRKIASTKEELILKQPGRMDICIPSWDGSKMIHHTYVFDSEKVKQNWLKNLRYSTLEQKDENQGAWVCAENAEEEDMILDSTSHLPLFVEHYNLTNNSESLSTECAAKTHSNHVWFASCSSSTAEVAIIQSVTPKPILLKSFTVDSSRILTMCYAPCEGSSSQQSSPHQSSVFTSGPTLQPHSETMWMGSQTGMLMIHPTSSDMAHKCMEAINFSEAITRIEYYENRMFIAVGGNIYVYTRPRGAVWDLDDPLIVKVHSGSDAITCTCQVQQKLWIGAGNLVYVLNMKSCRVEGHFQVSRQPEAMVRNMVSSGSGVWVSLRRSATVQLFHTVTKALLQDIDIKKAFHRTTAKHNIENKLQGLKNLHIQSLLLCQGYLWIGTSAGAIMIYRTPYLRTVPMATGKPFMAMRGHRGGVRVLVSVTTAGSLSSSRFDQFVSEEQERFQSDWDISDQSHQESGPAATLANSTTTTTTTTTSATFAAAYEGGLGVGEVSTFPPLPPPIFSDEASPTGTLKSVVEAQEAGTSGAVGGDGVDTTENGVPEHYTDIFANGEMKKVTSLSPETAATTPTFAGIAQPPASEDDISLPVRRKSSRWSNKASERERGSETGRRSSSTQDMDTFRRIDTLKAEQHGGIAQQMTFDHKGREYDDEGTIRRKPAPEVTPPPLYDDVTPEDSPYPHRRRSPSPYEDPATLHLTGPMPLRSMPEFLATLKQSMMLHHPSPDESSERAIYVLTGGRGLVNLRPGRRRSVHYAALSGSDSASTTDESCIIAYELKH